MNHQTTTPISIHRLTNEALRNLAESEGQPSVSIYMPTRRSGSEIRQDPIRFKNLVKEASAQLEQLDLDDQQVKSILDPVKSFPESESDSFWQNNSDGLALFLQPGCTKTFRIPVKFDELVVVADRFHIKPLFRYLQGDGHFFVLAVSPNRVRLLEGGKQSISELDVDTLPENLVDALNIDEFVDSLQFHSHTVGGASGATDSKAIYHGHGAGSDADKKEELLKYFRKLDDAVCEYFEGESAPLVFAGVEYLFPIYQRANNYQSLLDRPVTGNFDDASTDELHAEAWKVVSQQFSVSRSELIEKFGTAKAHGQGTDDLNEAIKSAREGRIATTLVAENVRAWGTIDESGTMQRCDENGPESEDLLDHLAAQTMQNGGQVYMIQPDQMPTDSPCAVIYRY